MHSLLLLPSQGRVRKQQWRDWLTDWLTVLLIFLPLKKFEASDSQLGKWGANQKKKDQRDRQTWQTCLAMGVAYESSCRTRSPIAMWGTCNSFASLLAYVPLPTPGHPRNTHCTPRPCSSNPAFAHGYSWYSSSSSRTAAAYPKLARCCCCCTTSKPSRRLETALWKAEIHSRLLLTTTVIMLFSSPSNASNFSLSLSIFVQRRLRFFFFLLLFLWLTLQTKKWYNNKLQYKNRCCAVLRFAQEEEDSRSQQRTGKRKQCVEGEEERRQERKQGRKEGTWRVFFLDDCQ